MNYDILQSTLDDLGHLLIPPSQITLKDDGELGVGGYGQVFLAVLESSDSQIIVAVKQLEIVQVKEVRRRVAIRLARELKVWAKAKHRNILELLGFYLSDDCLYAQFVSAYMANGNVKEYVDKLQPNLATRLRFVQGITSGISYLHNCNPAICHGDLKPTNVLVNENLDAVLCDFGLATFILEAGVSSGLTTSKSPKGSIRYMAPELLLDAEAKYTLESDVWAWACTAFEVLTDCPPFPDAKQEGPVVTAIILGRPPGSVDLLDNLVSDGLITDHPTLDSLKSIIPDCWTRISAKRPSLSSILDRLTFPDGIGAANFATESSHLPPMDDLHPELLLLPGLDSPTHGDVKKKRKRSPGLDGRPGKRACGKDSDAAIETVFAEVVCIEGGYGNGAISMKGLKPEARLCRWNPLKPNVLATGSSNGEVRLWNVPVPPAPLLDPVVLENQPYSAYGCDVTAIDWDYTGMRLATGRRDGILRIWNVEGELQSNLKFHTGTILSIVWSPSDRFLLSAGEGATVAVWDMRTPKKDKIYQVFRFRGGYVLDALWFDDETFISCGSDWRIHICRLREEAPLRTFIGHKGEVSLLRLSKDKTLLASASEDFSIRIWNMEAVETDASVQFIDPAQEWVLRGHDKEVWSLGWSPSSDPAMQYLLVSTSFDHTSVIWDARNGSRIKEIQNHRDMVLTQSFSPRGRYFATGSRDGRVLIYSSSTGTLLFDWDCQSGDVWDIQWKSAGDQLAVCLENGGVAVLDTEKLGFGNYVTP